VNIKKILLIVFVWFVFVLPAPNAAPISGATSFHQIFIGSPDGSDKYLMRK
jgi:hypothetical protein